MTLSISILKKIRKFVELVTNTEIKISIKPRVISKVHKHAVSDGRGMALYADLVNKLCTFKPVNVFEIGANYAQDAEYLRKRFGLTESDVYVFEPHPQIIDATRKLYNFHSYDFAIADYNGKAVFNAIDIEKNEYKNSGISSLKKGLTTNSSNFYSIDVDVTRMDDFIQKNAIESIDFLKIDVEGANYEVLVGFGNDLSRVKSIQIEGECLPQWEGQKLYNDIDMLLKQNDFELVYFLLSPGGVQSDSFWIQRRYIARGINDDI